MEVKFGEQLMQKWNRKAANSWHLPAVEVRFVPNDHDLHLIPRLDRFSFHAIDHGSLMISS